MEEVARAARAAIAQHDKCATISFNACLTKRKCEKHNLVQGWRMVTTDCHAIMLFFLACWNNRHALAHLRSEALG